MTLKPEKRFYQVLCSYREFEIMAEIEVVSGIPKEF